MTSRRAHVPICLTILLLTLAVGAQRRLAELDCQPHPGTLIGNGEDPAGDGVLNPLIVLGDVGRPVLHTLGRPAGCPLAPLPITRRSVSPVDRSDPRAPPSGTEPDAS